MSIKCGAWRKAHGFITAAPAAAHDVFVAMGCFDVVLVVACLLRWPGSTISTGAYRDEGGFSETQSACCRHSLPASVIKPCGKLVERAEFLSMQLRFSSATFGDPGHPD